jgi:hypothetical protein
VYYRVAFKRVPSAQWQRESTALSELSALFRWLRLYAALSHDRLRIFSSSSREEMQEQLEQENKGLGSTSITAAQFLRERRICCPEVARRCTSPGERKVQVAATINQTLHEGSSGASGTEERDISQEEKWREKLERGKGEDHDMPYRFLLPTSQTQFLAWMRLQAKVQQGELEP